MEIADFDEPHRAHCVAVMGWIERSVELSGGTQVEITERSCRAIGDARCRWRLRWQ
jgi:predicted hydrocarbon binding protein